MSNSEKTQEKKITSFGVHQKIKNAEIIQKFLEILIKDIPKSGKQLEKVKNAFAAEHNIPTIKNRDLIGVAKKYNISLPQALQMLIQKRAVRTISGVSPIGVLTKPFACPGKCTYCPTEDRMPKSYMKNQPAAARALRNNFDPFFQVKNRVIALEESGHPVSKLEIIVMGGTWSFLPRHYQEWYVTHLFVAANSFDTPEISSKKNRVILLSGTCGAGKTTISSVLEKKHNFVRICQDTVRSALFDNKHQPPFKKSAQNQEKKVYTEIFDQILKNYTSGKDIVIEAILNEVNQTSAEDFLHFFAENNILAEIFILQPDLETSIVRDKNRECWNVGEYRVKELWDQSEKLKNNKNIIFLDTTNLSIQETIEKVLDNENSEISVENYSYNPENFPQELGYEENNHLVAGKKEGEIVNLADQKISGDFAQILEEQQKINETASHRIIGLTLETRPDFITEKELIRMRKYGCTRIEIGVQTLNDEVQKVTKRGHDKKSVIRAMKLMKDFGFKVCFHLMPGLPRSTPEKDLESMKEVFENPDFRPDFIKIYPCMVLPTSELEGTWKEGNFTPISDQELIQVLLKLKAYVPEWTRIMRFMRDIPAGNILDGSKFSNLRQILQEQPEKLREIVGEEFYQKHNLEKNASKLFRDIRSREVGFSTKISGAPVLKRRNYTASQGEEIFLSFESEDESQLFALLRLRKPSDISGKNISDPEFSALFKNTAFIREVHSYGTELSVGKKSVETNCNSSDSGQHRGLGRRLIEEAEKIAKQEWGLEKMTIIAGVGTREYYRKFGYEEKLSYMVKSL